MRTIETMSKCPIKNMSDLWWIFKMRWSGTKNARKTVILSAKNMHITCERRNGAKFWVKKEVRAKGRASELWKIENEMRRGREWVRENKEKEQKKQKKEKNVKKAANGGKKCNETLDKS